MAIELSHRHLPLTTSTEDLLAALTAARFDSADIYHRLKVELERYEVRFGIASSEVCAHIRDGRLEETEDVCSWLISIRSFNALLDQDCRG